MAANVERHEQAAMDLFSDLEGGVTPQECGLLGRLASNVLEGCIVEIGSFRGKSAVALALGVRRNPRDPKPQIYCIEPHQEFRGYYGGRFGPEDRGAFYRVMVATGAFAEVALVNLSSEQAGPCWREPIGLLFVDGDHRYESVKRDFQCWEPHVLPGGVIAFDDSTDPDCGPSQVIDEILETGRFRYVETEGKITVIRKIRHDLDASDGVPSVPQRLLVVCSGFTLNGGLLRFERVGTVLRNWGHEVAYVDLAGTRRDTWKWNPVLPVLSLEQALHLRWDAVMVPGAGFDEEVIRGFSVFQKENFGTRVQHILNDQSRRLHFKMVNQHFRPHVVIFNNDQWSVGSFTDFGGDRFHVLLGGIDTCSFHPPTYRSHPLEPGKWIIGGLASKNPEPLVAALQYLPAHTSLWLYGEDCHGVAQRHAGLIRQGRLRLLGELVNEDLFKFYHMVDCVVMTETHAGWSNLVAEAMASGTPVVCTPHGTSGVARHGETALVIGRPNPVAIADGVLRLQKDPHLCRLLSESARKVISSYRWERYSRQLLRLIRHDGRSHYTHDPSSGLYGKWPVSQRLSGLEPLLARASGLSVIDVGAAEGVIAREFLKRGAGSVHGFELDPSRVAIAQAICAEWDNGHFRCGDLSDWDKFCESHQDLLQDHYDIVLYLGVHHHLPAHSRMKAFLGLLKLASRYFAIRTTDELYIEDALEDRLLAEGFRPVPGSGAGGAKWPGMGELKIYEKWASSSRRTRPLSRHFVSYPKSGRTWVRYILNQLKVDNQIVFHHDGFEFNDGSCPPHDFDVEKRIRRYACVDCLVYLERDPRDIMVSLYAQISGRFKEFFNYTGSISDFIRDPYFGAQNLERYRNIWNHMVERFGFLKITYEECHQDMQSVIARVLDYYGFSVPGNAISEAVENAEFAKMKRLEQSKVFPHPWLKPRNNAPKVRKGKIGGFREELSQEDIQYLNQIFSLADR
ncbi:Methyltransferase domain-containing protein [Desulfacinum infernum DSM 9756]|uniref:Methyltransferase domain-containing protein n=1 Tax=Desulfacinum infernum DSM 9756 TaxID=1121391 RepID=A0A1M5CU11_9BACT|nr:class I SAM-dependent methyltransferase [Desulfacinum infernum]SHF57832.1 Methyltransferase domain-containing protein [Desulfacinum infernum DSM 9756]